MEQRLLFCLKEQTGQRVWQLVGRLLMFAMVDVKLWWSVCCMC